MLLFFHIPMVVLELSLYVLWIVASKGILLFFHIPMVVLELSFYVLWIVASTGHTAVLSHPYGSTRVIPLRSLDCSINRAYCCSFTSQTHEGENANITLTSVVTIPILKKTGFAR